jgi:hypothetical protein
LKIFAILSDNDTRHLHAVIGQRAEYLDVKSGVGVTRADALDSVHAAVFMFYL